MNENKDKVHSRREWYQIGYKDAAKEILSPLLRTLSINIDTLNELQKIILMFAKQYGVEV